jgi:two-component system chemotaxis sensor kinase CheA
MEVIDDHLSAAAVRDGACLAVSHGGLRAITADVRRRLGTLERDCVQAVERASREVRHTADAAARLRLAPARAMFRFLERAARDAAQAEGKRVRFHAEGVDLRLEPEMLGVLQAALLHLVRNAVVHGVEPNPDVRRANGKPAEGTVTITVERVRQHVRFSCRDDGPGIDLDLVREALRRRGISPPLASDPHALLELLLDSGVSTAQTVTSLAGRGLGLGVVREAASRLGGRVDIRTTPGEGTTVEIVVPFSLASMPALLIEAADVSAAVPVDAVVSTVRIEEQQVVATSRGAALVVGGRSVPVVDLHRVVAPQRVPPSIVGRAALVMRSGDDAAAIVVDRILRVATLSVRPLPELAPASVTVIGASIDPSGTPRLVLDPHALVNVASTIESITDVPATPPDAVLVVDDSLTTRMLEQSILESAGYVVGLASCGEDGLEKARSGAFALFLVDVEMPDIDGFTFVERVRADPRIGGTPIILVTSRQAPADRERGRAVGANAYIVKSEFDQHVLLAHIRNLVQK